MKSSRISKPENEKSLAAADEVNEITCRSEMKFVNFPTSAEVFHAVFENSFYASCITNGHGKTLEANEKACKVFGYTQIEMTHLFTKDFFETFQHNYREFLAKRDASNKAEGIIIGIKRNGERFICEISSFVYANDKNEIRAINIIKDISRKFPNKFYLQ